MGTLVERLTDTVKTIGRRTLPYILAFNTLATQVGYALPTKNTNQSPKDTSYAADSSQVKELYGPEIPAGYGDILGPPTSLISYKEKGQQKQKPSIENMDIDSVHANYRFNLSMNQMEDGDEKRLIIAQYILAQRLANYGQLAEIETIDVDNPKELTRLNDIFHSVFLRIDPNRKTYENEFITQVLAGRVKYAGGMERKCFHDTDNRDLSVVRPVFVMLDPYGQEIVRVGYIEGDQDNKPTEGDILGSVRDKPQPTSSKSFDEIIVVRFPDNPRKERTFIRGPSTYFAWMEPSSTPEAQIAKAESAMRLNTGDSIPPLEVNDVAMYFIPVPDEYRITFNGGFYFSVNPKPFIVKSDSGKRVEFIAKTFVHGPDSTLVSADSVKRTIPVPPEGFNKDDRIKFSHLTSSPIYRLGLKEGSFQYSAEIFTVEDKPEKWSSGAGSAGSVWIRVDDETPDHFGYIADENGQVRVPAVGERGDSLRINFPNQLVSNDRRVSLPRRDSTGKYSLEYVVKAYIPSENFQGDFPKGLLWVGDLLERLVNETIRTGKVPATYERDVLVRGKIKGRVNGQIKERDTVLVETQTFNVTKDQRRYIEEFIAPTQQTEKAVFVDTLFGYVDSTTGEHHITIPLPDSIFQEGRHYDFSIEVNARDHSRISPDTFKKRPIAYQFGVVKNVKIVKKIPNQKNSKK